MFVRGPRRVDVVVFSRSCPTAAPINDADEDQGDAGPHTNTGKTPPELAAVVADSDGLNADAR